MQWEEVRRTYPDQYVKLQILAAHTEGNTKFIDEVTLIRAIQDPKEATKELLQSKDGVIVSHTANDELKVEIRTLRGLREACNMEMSMEQPALTDEQKKRMTSLIFTNANVLSQLRQAQRIVKKGFSRTVTTRKNSPDY